MWKIAGWRDTGRSRLDLFPGVGLTVVAYEATARTGADDLGSVSAWKVGR